jgi:2',3'-cyclic-nucleotide 2'-phosphodiesterase (5'-nucleotidase family)
MRTTKAFAAIGWLCGAALLLAAVRATVSLGTVHAAEKSLLVLFTNDLHSSFQPRSVLLEGGRTAQRGGWAKIATLIRGEKETGADRTLVVDGGDFSMGTLFHALFVREAAELRLLGEMGLEVTTLGNHEFDFRVAGLAGALRTAKSSGGALPAIVASNIVLGAGVEAGDARAFADYPVRDYLVLERGGLRIGLFGLMGYGAADDSPFIAPAVVADPIVQARRVVDVLRNRERVDLVIALSHSGTAAEPSRSEDVRLADAVPGIDVIVSGHSHTVLDRPITRGGAIIVSAGGQGEYLGRLELLWSKSGGARLASYALRPITPDIPDDPKILAAIAENKASIDREYLQPLGFSFDQVLAENALAMATPEEMEGRDAETGLGDLITDSYREAVRKAEGPAYDPIALVVEPSGSIRDTILPGPVTVESAFRVLSLGWDDAQTPGYPLIALYLRGREIRRLIEVGSSIGPRKSGAYLQLSGVRYTSNPHRMLFERAHDVSILQPDGSYASLEPDRLYRVCTNYYTGLMVDYISRASHGILKMQAKDRAGRLLADLKEAIVDGDPARPGVQPIKEWVALAEALKSFPDRDGNGIPDIPLRYGRPEGRYASVPSWNPVSLLAGAGLLTYGFLALVILVIALAVIFVRRRIRRRRSPHRG